MAARASKPGLRPGEDGGSARREETTATMKRTAKAKQRPLLATMTMEPFQPVRLYYRIPDRSVVVRGLRRLACMAEDPGEGCWQWLFHAEAASLRFGAGYEDVPEERRPIILGRIRFPESGGMTLQTNSIPRAIEGARFLGPRLGPRVIATRLRLVNRCFAADEGAPDELMKGLDRDVTVIDPRWAEADLKEALVGARSTEDVERAAANLLERKLASGEEVPEVEDFPLAPEEETPDFRELATTLQFRLVRAVEHWRGNTHLTLAAIIRNTVLKATPGRGGPPV